MIPTILIPAYGRKYNSIEECLKDWNDGKDFRIDGGPYCSIRDLSSMQKAVGTISIRWKAGLYINLGN